MIYLDNAASSFPKPEAVAEAVSNAIKYNGANPGRSGHFLSEKAAMDIFSIREDFGDYYLCAPENIVFTLNATMAINYVIKGIVRAGDHVLISDLEHNSVLRPVVDLYKKGVCDYDIVETSGDDEKTVDHFIKSLKKNTRLAVFTHASNVTGQLLPVDEIGRVCREKGIIFVVDASQASGLFIPKTADVICTAGHKGLYGPQGTGLFAVINDELCDIMEPFIQGGTGTDSMSFDQPNILPEGFESGTVNTPGILGLGQGLKFVKAKKEIFAEREKALQLYIIDELSKIDKVILYTDKNNSVPTLSFNIDGMISEMVTEKLNDKKICVRGGYHCAALCHSKLRTNERGAVRVSLGAFNTEFDAENFLREIRTIAK